MKLREIMNTPVLTIEEDEAIHKVAHIMSTNNLGSLIVTHAGKPVGIVTERDILKKVVATCRDVRNVKASDIMSKPLTTAAPDADLVYAANLMTRKDIKRLPIIENGRLVGIVTFTDLMRVYPDVVNGLEIAAEKLPKRFKKLLKR